MRFLDLLLCFIVSILVSIAAFGAPENIAKRSFSGRIVSGVHVRIRNFVGWELRDRTPVADWTYTIVDPNFAEHGMQAEVTLVRNNSDSTLWVLKQVVNGSWNSFYHLSQEIPRSEIWRQTGLSKVQVYWTPDGLSILKNYVPGPNGEDLLKRNPHFFSQESEARTALVRFINKAINSGYFIADLRLANLVYDGEDFQIVDSLQATRYDSVVELRKKYFDELAREWKGIQRNRTIVEGGWTTELISFLEQQKPICYHLVSHSPVKHYNN